jgi:hypothetical protein
VVMFIKEKKKNREEPKLSSEKSNFKNMEYS